MNLKLDLADGRTSSSSTSAEPAAGRGHAPSAVRDDLANARPRSAEDDNPGRPEAARIGDVEVFDDPLLEALVVLSQMLERPASRAALKAGLPLVDGRLTPELAVRAAARAGLSAGLMQRPLDQIHDLVLPCILLLNHGQACVLAAWLDGGRAKLVLPESGRGEQVVTRAELADAYAGSALFARPELALERTETTGADARRSWFWGTLITCWPIYGEVVLAAVMINLFALASPLFIMNVYDRVVPNAAFETLWVLAIGAITVFLFDFLLRNLRGYFVDSAGKIVDLKLAGQIFEHVLGIRMAARPASAGAFANNLREFESLRDFFTSATLVTVVDLPFVLFFIAVIWLIGGPVALIPALAVPVVIAAGLLLQIPLNRVVRQTFREAAQKHGVLVESINGLETIKSVGAEGRMQRNWEQFVQATATSATRARFLSALGVNVSALAQNLVTVGVVVFGVYLIAAGSMSVGALVACTIITGRAMAPLAQVAGILTRYHQARASYEALNHVMTLPVERPAAARFLHRPKLEGRIQFRNVSFTYPDQKLPALSEVSFTIQPGEKVALIGKVGSGKTTVEKLIVGLYQPDEGAVLVDGTDLRQVDPADLRRNVGCVLQDVYLFQGSIRDNIALGVPYADDAAIFKAAELAGADEFVLRHPQGFDRPVGERGDNLSGGQRQAVALARALLHDPPVLVLDEPSSAMDTAAEGRLKERLGRHLADRTLVLVTHRASLLGLVDRLIVLDGGRVVADGPRDAVLKALAGGQLRSRSA
ncbi:MAG: type I secretion system permease/ATPase [Geminicoccaceae bacterium]|nr:type I secretion system permease/ATPase [Geminicoccaceae bacterium]